MFIDIDEFWSAPISNVLQLNKNARHSVLLEQMPMYCQGCDDSKKPERELWRADGPSSAAKILQQRLE